MQTYYAQHVCSASAARSLWRPPPLIAGRAALHRRPCKASAAAMRRGRPAAAAAPAAEAQQPTDPLSQEDWRGELLTAALDGGQLVRLTLRGRIAPDMPYREAVVVPIMLRGKRHLKLSTFTERQDLTKNYAEQECAEPLGELLVLPWRSASLLTLQGSLAVQVTKRGKAVLQRQGPAARGGGAGGPALISAQPQAHDRAKPLPLPPGRPDAFLQRIGLQAQDGRVKAGMQDKYTQVNEFLKLLLHTGRLGSLRGGGAGAGAGEGGTAAGEAAGAEPAAAAERPVHILDAGCGAAHLTLCTYHYISNVMGGRRAVLTGVDSNAALMERSNQWCRELGVTGASFHTSNIRDFVPASPPDIVLALHACDTATDEALALGVTHDASIIMAVPCCHKDLHRQLPGSRRRQQGGGAGSAGDGDGSSSDGEDGGEGPAAGELDQQGPGEAEGDGGGPALLAPLLRHGIVKQRLVDLMTDSLRAQLLRICGYRTDVVEFVSTEHTPRNLLLRAVLQPLGARLAGGGLRRAAAEYVALTRAWAVTPNLQVLLQQAGRLPEELEELL